ncbi:hypothetical protein GCM10023185_37100 [Hymenobacter saemangeumensis]|uniref:Uncharacterized protein n=1 Tax=Hymenobacter saemangeumensis TaxID=1084522 RepID=A0ABP8IQS6_9BACT
MQDDELRFLEEQLAGTELLACVACGEDTLHAHLEVLEVYPVGTELLMHCTRCQTERKWMDWTPPTRQEQSN